MGRPRRLAPGALVLAWAGGPVGPCGRSAGGAATAVTLPVEAGPDGKAKSSSAAPGAEDMAGRRPPAASERYAGARSRSVLMELDERGSRGAERREGRPEPGRPRRGASGLPCATPGPAWLPLGHRRHGGPGRPARLGPRDRHHPTGRRLPHREHAHGRPPPHGPRDGAAVGRGSPDAGSRGAQPGRPGRPHGPRPELPRAAGHDGRLERDQGHPGPPPGHPRAIAYQAWSPGHGPVRGAHHARGGHRRTRRPRGLPAPGLVLCAPGGARKP
jgi:hypothetical protein